MMSRSFTAKALTVGVLFAIVLVWFVQQRSGNETFICDELPPCELGSGRSSLLSGIAVVAPLVAALGFLWTRRLHLNNKLGPFAYRAIPDSEQILEILAVGLAGYVAYRLATGESMIEAVDTQDSPLSWPNTWFTSDRDGLVAADSLVPDSQTWVSIGGVLSAPFAFSFGSMIGREWYGRLRRLAERDVERGTEHLTEPLPTERQ